MSRLAQVNLSPQFVAAKVPPVAAMRDDLTVQENMVLAARKTALAFKTVAAERPEADWHYQEGPGFILKTGSAHWPI